MSDLVNIGLLAFRNGRYEESADFLEQAVGADDSNWLARLYLSMTYQFLSRQPEAYKHLLLIARDCPDKELRDRAKEGLRVVASQLSKHGPDKSETADSGDAGSEAAGT